MVRRFTLYLVSAAAGCIALMAAAYAQPGAGYGLELSLTSGKMVKHTRKIAGPVPDHSFSAELHYVHKTSGSQDWQVYRGYPQVGFGSTYTVYGIDSLYGRCLSIYPDLQFNIVAGNRLSWTFRAGFGLGYVSRHYERTGNPLNTAIGSHLNNFTLLSTDIRYRVNDRLDVQAGARFSHISNAALRQPNLGLNMWGISAGLRYFPVTSRPALQPASAPRPASRWGGGIRLGFAYNEAGFADGPILPSWLVTGFVSRRWNGYNSVYAGLDYSYHKRVEVFLKNNEILPGKEKANSWRSAVFVGNEFLYGRVGIILQVGVYLKEAALRFDPYYEKLGAHFYFLKDGKGFLKKASFGILLKTHKTQAELAECGISMGF